MKLLDEEFKPDSIILETEDRALILKLQELARRYPEDGGLFDLFGTTKWFVQKCDTESNGSRIRARFEISRVVSLVAA